MITGTCKNVRRELEEAASSELLSSVASEHLRSCAECARLHDDDTKLRGIMASLGTIEAPGDFDFKLRARLAEERAGAGRQISLGGFSFGLRSVAFASLLLVFGSVMFLSLRSSDSQGPVATVQPPAAEGQPTPIISAANNLAEDKTKATETTPAVATNLPTPTRNRGSRAGMVAVANRGSRDLASKPARVIRPSELNARASDFQIAGRQPLKVSLENGSGTSRTISLPAVSFGSQRVLSQNSSPLMASARGSW